MSTTYVSALDWVLPDLPMCPQAVAVNAIRDTVIEFCEKSLVYRQELQEILVIAPTTTTLSVAAISGATSVTVASVTNLVDGATITILLTDGSHWRGHVSGTPVGSVVTLDGPLQASADSGAEVKRLVYLYPLTLPTGFVLAKGLQAWLNDNPIDPISQDDLDNEFNNTNFGWVGVNWRTDVNLPTRFYFPDDNTVGLALAPNAAGNLRINAALKPTRASTTFPTVLFERYIEAIAHGAKARLMAIPKKPYTDLPSSQWHLKEFDGWVGEARIRAARAGTRAPLRNHVVYGLR